MKCFYEAYTRLIEGLQETLQPLIDEEIVKNISIMGVSVGVPEMPFLEIWNERPFTNISDSGFSEILEGDIIFSSQVLNTKNPNEGIDEATSIISEVHKKIRSSRRLKNLGVYYIKTKEIGWVPYGFGKNNNVYGAGVTFTIRMKIEDPQCK